MSTLSAAVSWEQDRQAKRNLREAQRSWQLLEIDAQEDGANYEDQRSGVFLVFDQQKIVAIWVGVYVRESERHEQEDRGLALAHRTPQGVPVLFQQRGRTMFITGARLRKFENEMQRKCVSVPRSFLESLAETSYSRFWLQLKDKEKLATLDCIADLYSFAQSNGKGQA